MSVCEGGWQGGKEGAGITTVEGGVGRWAREVAPRLCRDFPGHRGEAYMAYRWSYCSY